MKTIAYISSVISFLPAVIAVLKLKSAGTKFRLILLYFILCCITEVCSLIIISNHGNNNLLADIFYLTEGLLLITYYQLTFNEKEFRYPYYLLFGSYLLFGLYTTLVDPGPEAYNSTFRTGESLIIQALAGYSLIRISKQSDFSLMKNPEFWFSAGFFTYFSVGIAIFFTATFIFDESKHFMVKTWIIHSVVNIMANFVFAYGLYCIPSKKIV